MKLPLQLGCTARKDLPSWGQTFKDLHIVVLALDNRQRRRVYFKVHWKSAAIVKLVDLHSGLLLADRNRGESVPRRGEVDIKSIFRNCDSNEVQLRGERRKERRKRKRKRK